MINQNKMPAQDSGNLYGRFVTLGMVVVILFLAGFSIGTEITVKQAADNSEHYEQLSSLYQEARYAVGAEESLERKYRLEPGPDVLAKYKDAANTLVEKLKALKNLDTGEAANVDKILTLHENYLKSINKMFTAVDAGDTARVLAIDAEEVDPLFSEIDQRVNSSADQHQQDAGKGKADFTRIQNWVYITTPIVFIIGLILIYGFWVVLRTYENRINQANKLVDNSEQKRVDEIEQSMSNRTRELNLAIEVGRSLSRLHALDEMLHDASELIRSRFDLYYVQIYLTNSNQTTLFLQAGTGTMGAELVRRGHQLPLDTNSINGRAAAEKHSVVISDTSTANETSNIFLLSRSRKVKKVVSDTSSSNIFRPNPLLPETRSEMAIPLIVDEKVVGVLDLQNNKVDSLNQDILPSFEALAGQLAIAIQNANLLAETNRARAEVEAQSRRLTRANWMDYLDAIHKPEETGFVFEQNKISPMTQQPQPSTNGNALTAPIAVTGEHLGNLVVEMEGQSPIARADELVNSVASQVAQQIESLRLLDSAERYRAEAEQASRRLTHEGWQDYMKANIANEGMNFIYDLNEVRPFNPAIDQQAEKSAFTLLIKVRDEVVGKLIVQGLEANDSEALDLAYSVAERLGAHIEGLRLTNQTEQALATTKKQAEREQALRQITSAVRGSTDPTTILRTAARELGTLLGRKTVIRLETAQDTQTSQTQHPVELAGESIANNGHGSDSSADHPISAVGGNQ